MSQLTKEQIEAAVQVFNAQEATVWGIYRAGLIAAAPYLQFPWEGLSRDEASRAWDDFVRLEKSSNYDRDSVLELTINRFIVKRNSAQVPKPDPRRKILMQALAVDRMETAAEAADRILAQLDALDKEKP